MAGGLVCLWLALGAVAAAGSEPLPEDLRGPRVLTALPPSYAKAVVRGWRYFQTSYAADRVACVDCHRDHGNLATWAPGYPKVQAFDGTPNRVKTLREVLLEALERHTDLGFDQRQAMVEDLGAFVAWWGDGRRVRPGRTRTGVAPPEEDRAALAAAVERGRRRVESGMCASCHDASEEQGEVTTTPWGEVATSFPRVGTRVGEILCLESYLADHLASVGLDRVLSEGSTVTDLTAFLMAEAAGHRLRPGGSRGVVEE